MNHETQVLVGVTVICMGIIMHILGMTLPSWTEFKFKKSYLSHRMGIFRLCELEQECTVINDASDNLKSTQAVLICGCLFAIASIPLALVFVFKATQGTKRMRLDIVAFVTAILSLVLILAGIVIFRMNVEEIVNSVAPPYKIYETPDLGFAFHLSIWGGILNFLGGCGVMYAGSALARV